MFGLDPEVVKLFTPYFQYTDGRLYFVYHQTVIESWAPAVHRIPSTPNLWLAGTDHPNLVGDLYISHSAAELLFFASQRSFDFLKYPNQKAFAALGLLPSATQVETLKFAFPHARWHLLFGPELLGRIADAAVASWYKKRSVSFVMNNDRLAVNFCGKWFAFDSGLFSMHKFERSTGLRAGMRTHKPPQSFLSFIELQFPNHDSRAI